MLYLLLSLLAFQLPLFAETCPKNFDGLGIAHVRTTSEEEFYYCFGELHGMDRAWQMDFFRRTGQGRNAEVLGLKHLKGDLMMRLLNLEPLAAKLWQEFPARPKALLEAYARGVNAGLKEGKLAKEFVDAGYEPEAWKPEHSVLILLLQAFDQTKRTFFKDYEEELQKQKWGSDKTALFYEEGAPWFNTILKAGEYPKKTSVEKKSSFRTPPVKLWSDFPTIFGEESGSNNWVISKAKSKTGYALLANDPHLDLKTPLMWYWVHLKGPQEEVIGASLPGVPVVASGTNGKVAWGLTNSYLNTADAVLLKDAGSFIESTRPVVWIKFGPVKLPFFFKSFERTKTGRPLLPLEIESPHKLALRWSGHQLKAMDLTSMFELHKAETVSAMDETLKKVGLPSWNFVFADSKGDIGFRLVGHAYRHYDRTPFGLPVMTAEEFQQEKFLTPEERPAVLRPSRQYIYTANNRHWPVDAAFYGGRGYSYSYRGQRIDELLGPAKHDVESFKNIQCDQMAVDARYFLPLLRKYLPLPELRDWDLIVRDSVKGLVIYRRLMDLLTDRWKVNDFALYRMLENLPAEQIGELKELEKIARSEVGERSWGEVHRLNFPHMAQQSDWVFAPDISGPGDNHSVNPGTAIWNPETKRYQQSSGASMRMIVELKERPNIFLSLPGKNRNYQQNDEQNPWQAWKECRYQQIEF